jgi:hypothetical protein
VESKWKNYHIITFPGQSLSKTLEEAMDLSQDRLILELEPGNNTTTKRKKDEKFWEELIAYVPLIRHGPHRKLSRCLATIKGLLPSRCLVAIRGETRTHGQQRDLISIFYLAENTYVYNF